MVALSSVQASRDTLPRDPKEGSLVPGGMRTARLHPIANFAKHDEFIYRPQWICGLSGTFPLVAR